MSRNRKNKGTKSKIGKASVEVFLDSIKDLSLQIHTDAYGMTSIKDGKCVLTYINDTKYGISYQERANTGWGFKTVQIKTIDEIETKVDDIRRYFANKDKIELSLQPHYHCQFNNCNIIIKNRKDMTTHIREVHKI